MKLHDLLCNLYVVVLDGVSSNSLALRVVLLLIAISGYSSANLFYHNLMNELKQSVETKEVSERVSFMLADVCVSITSNGVLLAFYRRLEANYMAYVSGGVVVHLVTVTVNLKERANYEICLCLDSVVELIHVPDCYGSSVILGNFSLKALITLFHMRNKRHRLIMVSIKDRVVIINYDRVINLKGGDEIFPNLSAKNKRALLTDIGQMEQVANGGIVVLAGSLTVTIDVRDKQDD